MEKRKFHFENQILIGILVLILFGAGFVFIKTLGSPQMTIISEDVDVGRNLRVPGSIAIGGETVPSGVKLQVKDGKFLAKGDIQPMISLDRTANPNVTEVYHLGVSNDIFGIYRGTTTLTGLLGIDPQGNLRFSGELQSGSVPWQRLTNFPSSCPSGQYVSAIGQTLTCSSPGAALPSGSAGQTLRHDGTNWVANSLLFNDGTRIGIGTTMPVEKLDVAGAIKIGNTTSPCDANHRGVIKFIPGGAGVADHLAVCEKRADETYVWVYIASSIGGWAYRKPITISNPGGALTNYQVLITLDTASLISAGKMRNDCADIRFTDLDGITQLNYWLESGCNTVSARLWVKVPSIPASATKTIYLYYGNPTATSQSNPENVFGYDIAATYVYYKYLSPIFYWENRVSSTDLANGDDRCSASQTLQFNAHFYGTDVSSFYVSSNGVMFLPPTTCSGAYYNSLSTFITWKAVGFWDDLRTDRAGGIVSAPGVYYDSYSNKARITWEVTRYGASSDSVKFQVILFPSGKVIFSIDGATNFGNFSPTVAISKGDSSNYINITAEKATNRTWYFYLRKYTSPEPTTSVGVEESAG